MSNSNSSNCGDSSGGSSDGDKVSKSTKKKSSKSKNLGELNDFFEMSNVRRNSTNVGDSINSGSNSAESAKNGGNSGANHPFSFTMRFKKSGNMKIGGDGPLADRELFLHFTISETGKKNCTNQTPFYVAHLTAGPKNQTVLSDEGDLILIDLSDGDKNSQRHGHNSQYSMKDAGDKSSFLGIPTDLHNNFNELLYKPFEK